MNGTTKNISDMNTLPQHSFTTLAEVKAVLKAQGSHFFDRKTMAFFRSRIESGLLHGAYFITSGSDMRDTGRFYNVRSIGQIVDGECAGEITINTVSEFNALKTLSQAKELVKKLATNQKVNG
jgi:hypothetical protein